MTELVAAFPMYNRPELRGAFDALWAATRDGLRAAGVEHVPRALIRIDTGLLDFWQRPDLLLSQACGMPFRHVLKDRVTLVGTPDFGLMDCPPGYYRSALIVRADDPRARLSDFQGATLVCNEVHSQSGYAAPLVAAHEADLRFGAVVMSGAHLASARMVSDGGADIAGLDAVSWRHMRRFDPFAGGLRVLEWTMPTPGLPFITAFGPLASVIGTCLEAAIAVLPDDLRAELTIKGLVRIPPETYARVPDPPQTGSDRRSFPRSGSHPR